MILQAVCVEVRDVAVKGFEWGTAKPNTYPSLLACTCRETAPREKHTALELGAAPRHEIEIMVQRLAFDKKLRK